VAEYNWPELPRCGSDRTGASENGRYRPFLRKLNQVQKGSHQSHAGKKEFQPLKRFYAARPEREVLLKKAFWSWPAGFGKRSYTNDTRN
jgi:hypothetical protein